MKPTLTYHNLTFGESNLVSGGETSGLESETNLVSGRVMQKFDELWVCSISILHYINIRRIPFDEKSKREICPLPDELMN